MKRYLLYNITSACWVGRYGASSVPYTSWAFAKDEIPERHPAARAIVVEIDDKMESLDECPPRARLLLVKEDGNYRDPRRRSAVEPRRLRGSLVADVMDLCIACDGPLQDTRRRLLLYLDAYSDPLPPSSQITLFSALDCD